MCTAVPATKLKSCLRGHLLCSSHFWCSLTAESHGFLHIWFKNALASRVSGTFYRTRSAEGPRTSADATTKDISPRLRYPWAAF